MAANDEILALCQKLKNMTFDNGCTPNEAKFAAEKLQKLLTEHQLSMADIEGQELGEGMETEKLWNGPGASDILKNKRWRRSTIEYASNIASAFNCRFVYNSYRLSFLGAASDVKVARFFFETTWLPIREEGKRQGREQGYRHAELIAFYDQFLYGAGVAIRERLSEQSRQAERESVGVAALVPLKAKKVNEYLEKMHPKLKSDKYDGKLGQGAGVGEGYEYGQQMDLNQPLEGRPRAANALEA